MNKEQLIKDLKVFLIMTICAMVFTALVKDWWLNYDINWIEEIIHWSLFSIVMTFIINHTRLINK
jgi:hypothetical protein